MQTRSLLLQAMRITLLSCTVFLAACPGRGGPPGLKPADETKVPVAVQDIPASVFANNEVQMVSSVGAATVQTNGATTSLNALNRDVIGLMANNNPVAYAIQEGNAPAEVSPSSTAVFMVLKIRELTQLPPEQLQVAIADIKATAAFPALVSYIQYSQASAMKDPLNTQTNAALLLKLKPVVLAISPEKYMPTSAAAGQIQPPAAKQWDAAELLSQNGMWTGGSTAARGQAAATSSASSNAFTCTGAYAEICAGTVTNDTITLNNFKATPYAVYMDEKPHAIWDNGFAFGRDSALEKTPLNFKWNDNESYAQNMSTLFARTVDYALSFERGSAQSTINLPGVGTGKHKIVMNTMGMCRFVENMAVGSAADITSMIGGMTDAQWAALGMNTISLAMTTAGTAVGAADVNATRANGLAGIKGNMAGYQTALKGLYQKADSITKCNTV